MGAELTADPAWTTIDFLSDLHLQASLPRTFAAFEQHLLTTPAQAVFLLGDIFEVWVGDDAADGGFEARCAGLLRRASEGRQIWFMHGNRDFLVGEAFVNACGMHLLADPTTLVAFGQRWVLTHGDALCLDDHAYQTFRRQVRSEAWQDAFLARPLAERRAIAADLRRQSEARKRDLGPDAYADADLTAVQAWLDAAGARTMIHGHTHRPADHALPGGRLRHVLSDWDLDHTGSTRQAGRAQVSRLDARGLHRIDLHAS